MKEYFKRLFCSHKIVRETPYCKTVCYGFFGVYLPIFKCEHCGKELTYGLRN